jgi:hypothetical protein
MKITVARHVAAGAVALVAAGCGAVPPDATGPMTLDAAVAALAADGPRWAHELCDGELVEGVFWVPPETFAILLGAHTSIDMAGNRAWSLVVGFADRADRAHLYVHERDRDAALGQLREANGQPVWFLGANAVHAAHELHLAAATARELAAVQHLLAVPLPELLEGVAHADRRVAALFASLRARRLTAQQVLAQLEPWDERLLPALLHEMAAALTAPRAGDPIDPPETASLSGYVAKVGSTFDVACLASQALRGFLAPPDDDAGRRAHLRALAFWLRLARLQPMPHTALSR